MHAWTEEEKTHIVEIMMHLTTYYEVSVKLHVPEDKEIDFDGIITEGIRHELQIQQYNSNRDKVELAPYNKAIENHALTFTKQHHREPSQSTASRAR